ncbi:hypothetical protein MNBD_GAMMA09-2222 [hydrothermal vent metagenome]|uniref:VOC domain-containing protein n=1 Tax=hydrothermal vent metagenome TaxID=652676 RepID=A0A3B0YNV0_9ZZZZ
MNFDGLIPVILCRHIEKTLAFYQNAFRYIIINKTETDDGLQWAHIKSDNTFLMLQKIKSTADSHQAVGNFTLHYYTSDVTAQHSFMTARGIKTGELEDTAYHVRQFKVTDPEGNILSIGQSSN